MKLIYRGHTYDYSPIAINATYRKPRALNWRYQLAAEESNYKYQPENFQSVAAYQKPRALNWRYQVAEAVL